MLNKEQDINSLKGWIIYVIFVDQPEFEFNFIKSKYLNSSSLLEMIGFNKGKGKM